MEKVCITKVNNSRISNPISFLIFKLFSGILGLFNQLAFFRRKTILTICKHPLIEVKLSIMRDEKTKSKEFKESLDEIASLMCYEIFKDLKVVTSN